jgi:hypothetical protein
MLTLQSGDDIIFDGASLARANLAERADLQGMSFTAILRLVDSGAIDIERIADILDSLRPIMDERLGKEAFKKGGPFFGCRWSEVFEPHVGKLIEDLLDRSNKADEQHREAAEMAKPITVKGFECRRLMKFPILYSGWESDADGWVVEVGGDRKLVMTNHGDAYFADVEEVKSLIESYYRAINASVKALDMVKGLKDA